MSNEIELVEISNLLLDPENPRLPESVERKQIAMLDYIAETTAIEELMLAIGENGFFPGEPLVVVPHSDNSDQFLVVEGNRRLTALKLLSAPTCISNPGARMKEISQNAKHRPPKVPVVRRENRSDVLPYLGFRHITGVKQWEPLAKARYIEQLFKLTNTNETPKNRYNDVARAIGSRKDHIKRNLDALSVYKIVKDKNFYDIDGLDDTSLKFSVLSTALADERIGSFVGIQKQDLDSDEIDPIVDPSHLKHKEIEELIKWLFEKNQKGSTTVGESRNLRLLSAVVSNSRALEALRKGSTLKISYQYTSDLKDDFAELLYQAEAALKEAVSMIATVQFDEDLFQVIRSISANTKLIGREFQEKRTSDDEF